MKIQNKDKIRLVAMDIIAYDGIDKLSMSNLAKNLDIEKASLYYWYKSKEEIIEDIYTSGHKRLMSRGFTLSLSGNIEEVLLSVALNWEDILKDEEIASFLRLCICLHLTDKRAMEEYKAFSLMLKSQAEVVISSFKSPKIQKNNEILSLSFYSILFSDLEKILEDDDVNLRDNIIDFSRLLEQLKDL